MLFSIAALTNRYPGSLIPGIPASVATKTSLLEISNLVSSSIRSVSLPSKKEMIFPLYRIPNSWHNLENLRESSAAMNSTFSIIDFKFSEASAASPIGKPARISMR